MASVAGSNCVAFKTARLADKFGGFADRKFGHLRQWSPIHGAKLSQLPNFGVQYRSKSSFGSSCTDLLFFFSNAFFLRF
ncbi:hypothetical protein L6164_015120 [Bauhinia variegata]|uniref:Uncharacterized protein n=1 Tax=Bauhinia variegata TaxID=167791 RepID=A0ACB9NNA4_BAUVA|nr:hypothetical protein L6164_015120 [Bauhinia variegata]